MALVPYHPLDKTGKTIPLLGFGTAEFPFAASSQKIKESILEAIKLGYRHFDSAALYQTEHHLGEAIEEALNLGLIKSRDELFITTKLWCSDAHHDRVLPALQKALKKLKLEYVNLFLIHLPVSMRPPVEQDHGLPGKNDILTIDIKSVWEDMEKCKKFGFAKLIGVSNFSCVKLEQLLATANIPPAVNQVEMNPLWRQKELREFCKEKGIHITAFSPLGAKGTLWGSNWVMDCEVLKQIANENQKTVAQVCLRWVFEQGVSVLVKSFNKERMEENLDIFNWKLSEDDSKKINQIPQRKGFLAQEFISKEGPFKSLEDLWDEKI